MHFNNIWQTNGNPIEIRFELIKKNFAGIFLFLFDSFHRGMQPQNVLRSSTVACFDLRNKGKGYRRNWNYIATNRRRDLHNCRSVSHFIIARIKVKKEKTQFNYTHILLLLAVIQHVLFTRLVDNQIHFALQQSCLQFVSQLTIIKFLNER